MFRSLYLRLAAILVVLFAAVAAACLAALVYLSNWYLDEQSQRVNADLAMYIAKEHRAASGALDLPKVQMLFGYVAMVNPMTEAYLLDPSGRVLAHSVHAAMVKRTHVSLEPIRAFLDKRAAYPIRGDDPCDPNRTRVFSAAAIAGEAAPLGYIYVLLAGGPLSSAPMWAGSQIFQLAAAFILACVVFAAVAGLLLFRALTGRLERLSRAVDSFKARDFAQAVPLPPAAVYGDEIDRLTRVFGQMTERILEQIRKLEANDRSRRESIASASHDLRTPLAALQGYLDTLRMKGDRLTPEQRQQYLDIAHRHGQRLGALVDEMFELARLESPEPAFHAEVFPIDELVADVVQKFHHSAERKSITLTAALEARGGFVNGDIALLERVFENLIENALRHTPAGGAVTVTLAADDTRVTLAVRDTGEGIAPELLPHVFERFTGTRRDDGPASGLGLAIVKRIIELHASEISVSSTLGRGSEFRFSLARTMPAGAR